MKSCTGHVVSQTQRTVLNRLVGCFYCAAITTSPTWDFNQSACFTKLFVTYDFRDYEGNHFRHGTRQNTRHWIPQPICSVLKPSFQQFIHQAFEAGATLSGTGRSFASLFRKQACLPLSNEMELWLLVILLATADGDNNHAGAGIMRRSKQCYDKTSLQGRADYIDTIPACSIVTTSLVKMST
jgi:hypothetical protein